MREGCDRSCGAGHFELAFDTDGDFGKGGEGGFGQVADGYAGGGEERVEG